MFTSVNDPNVYRIVKKTLSGQAGKNFSGAQHLANCLLIDELQESERQQLSVDRPVEVVIAVGYAKGWIVADSYGIYVQDYIKS